MNLRPRVRTLLAGLVLVALALPALALAVTRVVDNQIVRRTEATLLSEAVVVGEVYRQLYDDSALAPLGEDSTGERYHPFLPALDLRRQPILGPAARTGTSTAPSGARFPLRMTRWLSFLMGSERGRITRCPSG